MFPIFLDMPPFLLVLFQILLESPITIKALVPLIVSSFTVDEGKD